MNIRKATLSDLKAIQELNLLLFKKEYNDYDKTLNGDWTFSESGSKHYQEKITDSNSFAAVAEDDGNIIGYLVGGISKTPIHRKISKLAELENMYIDEKYRSQGIGKKLVEEFISWCKDQEVERIKVIVFSENDRAMDFYHVLSPVY